jgi:hypothetical protein
MADQKERENSEPEDPSIFDTIEKPIVHEFPEGLDVTFSDNVAVQHTPSEFIITFAQLHHPMIRKSDDYDDIESIKAKVVARIVLTPPKMLEFIQSLQDNWRIYQRRMKAIMEAKANVATDKPPTDETPDDSPSGD